MRVWDSSLTLAVMVPCFSPLLLIILIPAAWNMRFISSGVAVVAKSTSWGCFPDRRSRTAPPAILSSKWCFWKISGQTHNSYILWKLCSLYTNIIISTWVVHDVLMKIFKWLNRCTMSVLPARAFSPSLNNDWNSLVFSCMVKKCRWLHVRRIVLTTWGMRNLLPHIWQRINSCK